MRATFTLAQRIVDSLTLADKIRLVSGLDLWNTEGVDDAPGIMVTDGPHGVRKQADDQLGLGNAVPATCFPTAATLGATWDPALLEEIGAALGRESRAENVGVLLGPGLNIKRHPAGGRSFEYFSEDPFHAGHMAAALTRGIQSQGVGACLKHYAVNNQESRRFTVDAIVDERTLREIYLTGFEIAVKESDPWTVMSSYNKVNGEHTGETRQLMTTILREEWGFDGLVMTDWLATFDRPAAIQAGLDLEMPGSGGTWDAEIRSALADGRLAEPDLALAATRVVDLNLRARAGKAEAVDFDAHHALARRAAAAGTVLLANDGMLPLKPTGTIAVIGAFADEPRYQGAGSSLVTPTRLDTFLESFTAAVGSKATVSYAAGYSAATGETTEELLSEAVATASAADAVVLMAGLPAILESEGYDREHLRLPHGVDAVVAAVTGANARTAVVLVNGAPVLMPWADRAAAVVEAYLGGQAGGSAIADVILGAAEPGGRLAESFPVSADDIAAGHNFPGAQGQVEYREGLYVGYRFHDSAGVAPRYAFGHGLGYTSFIYDALTVRKAGDSRTVTMTVTNTGKRTGSEVVQLYVRDVESTAYRPAKELKGFAKVTLDPGTSTKVTLTLDRRSFAVWDVVSHEWLVEPGEFEILVGASSADIRLRKTISIDSDDVVTAAPGPVAFVATDAEFAAMLGHAIPSPRPSLPFHADSTVDDLRQTALGRQVANRISAAASKALPESEDEITQAMFQAMVKEMPLRGISMASGGKLSLPALRRLIRLLNAGSIKAWRAR